jgi:phytoene dehydrogenase-like protein
MRGARRRAGSASFALRRRELLYAVFGAPFAAQLLSSTGCASKPVVRGPIAGGFVEPSMGVGHLLRGAPPSDEQFARAPTQKTRVAIVGGGPAGLSSAWALARAGFDDFALLELEPSVGGTSVSGAAKSTAYPWGAHYVTTPLAEHTDLIALLRELDALEDQAGHAHPVGREQLLVREPKERVFYKGFFYPGLYLHVGATAQDLAQLARFEGLVDQYAALRDARGRRAFSIPVDESSDDAELTALDRVSAADWLRSQGLSSTRLLAYAEHACRDDYGLTLEHTSAWALLFYYAARKDPALDHESEVITWPEGNGAIVAHLAKAAGPRIRTGKLVVDVVQHANEAHVHLIDAATRAPERVIAERVIVATPHFIAERVVRALREAAPQASSFTYGAWLVANLHLRERPASRGAPPAWDNVLYESPALGYVTATHQRGRDRGPTVLTYYLPMTDGDARAGRRRLLEPSFDEWTEAVCSDLEAAHPDLREHVERIDVCRFGHGMVQPRVGSLWSPARRAAATPLGALHFAHSDLSGIALFEEAFHHGVRAAREVLSALATGQIGAP